MINLCLLFFKKELQIISIQLRLISDRLGKVSYK